MTNPQRRRPETELFWRGKLAELEASGLTVKEFADREGIRAAVIYRWKKEIKQRDKEILAQRKVALKVAPDSAADSLGSISFVPVELKQSVSNGMKARTGTQQLEIHTPAGLILVVPAGVDATTLQMVLSVLRDATCGR